MSDRFIIWLRNKLRNKKTLPPEASWQEISRELDIDAVWEKVERQLDIDAVWQRTKHQLDDYAQVRFFEKFAYLPLLLVILLFGADFYFSADDHVVPAYDQVTHLASGIGEEEKRELKDPETSSSSEITSIKRPETQNPVIPEVEKSENTESKDRAAALEPESTERTLFLQPYALSRPGYGRALAVSNRPGNFIRPEALADTIVADGRFRNREWFLGGGASVRMGWLVNNRTIRGDEGSDLISTRVEHTYDFSLHAGLKLRKNWAVQTNMILFSQIRQSYGEYVNGHYLVSDDLLNYSGMQLLIKRKIRPILLRTSRKHLFAGTYAHYLTRAHERRFDHLNDTYTTNNLRSEYKPFDFGLIAGIEFERYIFPGWTIHYNIHASYGFGNIYSGNNIIPGYLRRTHTATIGVQVGLRKYR